MLKKRRHHALLKSQVVPAIGCTEPMAVALCVARASRLLGCRPERISLRLSANILKNAMGVGIPGTGMIGLPIAVALGALIGRPECGLEVLCDCNCEAVEAGKQYIAENRIHIVLEEHDPDKLFIYALCSAGKHEAEACIKSAAYPFRLCSGRKTAPDGEGSRGQGWPIAAARHERGDGSKADGNGQLDRPTLAHHAQGI